MRSVGIDVNHEAFNVLSCEPADRFFDAIGRYFLQYMRFLRVHARITALGQLDATKFDGFLTIANADMTEKHPVAVANKVEMQQCFQTLIFEYGQFFMALCEYHDPELERIVLKVGHTCIGVRAFSATWHSLITSLFFTAYV